MGPEDNAELVRKGYAAFNAADGATLMELLAENASWHTPGRSAIAGLKQGRDAVLAHFGRYGSETDGTFKAALAQALGGADGCVVGIHRNTGERNGKRLDVMCCVVFEISDGRMTSGREYFEDLHAWDAFWG